MFKKFNHFLKILVTIWKITKDNFIKRFEQKLIFLASILF